MSQVTMKYFEDNIICYKNQNDIIYGHITKSHYITLKTPP